jgi:hypothetical protein
MDLMVRGAMNMGMNSHICCNGGMNSRMDAAGRMNSHILWKVWIARITFCVELNYYLYPPFFTA